ncbi:DUF2092 domain-containing protein [bacterium]|nr:DUF2092 domain-containing protein [bacterium]
MRFRCVVLGIGLFSFTGSAEPTDGNNAAEIISPASSEPALVAVLHQAEAFLAKQKSIHVIARYRWESGVEGKKEAGQKRIEGWLVRPSHFRLMVTREGVSASDLLVVGDGRTAYTYLPPMELFSASPLVGPKAGLERNAVVAQALAGSGLEMTWRPDMARFVVTQAQNILDRGVEKNNDVEGRHFSFSFGDVRVQVWFTTGEEPILKRVKRSTKLATAGGSDPFELDIVSDLTWDFSPINDDNLFRFSRSPSAKRVHDLYAALAGEDPQTPAQTLDKITLLLPSGKETTLPKDKPTLMLVGLAWDESMIPLGKALLLASQTKAEPAPQVAVVVVGDEVSDLAPFSAALPTTAIMLDRTGTLPTALSQDTLPILVAWNGTATTHVAVVSESTLAEEVKKAINAPQK